MGGQPSTKQSVLTRRWICWRLDLGPPSLHTCEQCISDVYKLHSPCWVLSLLSAVQSADVAKVCLVLTLRGCQFLSITINTCTDFVWSSVHTTVQLLSCVVLTSPLFLEEPKVILGQWLLGHWHILMQNFLCDPEVFIVVTSPSLFPGD
jgi:hypothetical protein